MPRQVTSLDNLVRKAVTLAHVGRRGQPAPAPGDEIKHSVTVPSSMKGSRPQTFAAGFVGGGPDAQSLVTISLDGTEIFRARVGPDFRNNPDRITVEATARFPTDWREQFMALALYA